MGQKSGPAQNTNAAIHSIVRAPLAQLGNDVRQQLVLDRIDPVLQRQFALLQAFDLQLIGRNDRLESDDFRVEGPVLGNQAREHVAQVSVI